jgi:hypothetical protein
MSISSHDPVIRAIILSILNNEGIGYIVQNGIL